MHEVCLLEISGRGVKVNKRVAQCVNYSDSVFPHVLV
jgi:hypothetical protein